MTTLFSVIVCCVHASVKLNSPFSTKANIRTLTRSLTAISLSCLGDGFDDEAVDVENRAEKRENALRDIAVPVKRQRGINRLCGSHVANRPVAVLFGT